MKKQIFLLINCLIVLSCGGMLTQISAQSDKRVEEIRRIYQETNQKVAECEVNGETSAVYLTEMTVNKNNGSYPAVGIYKSVIKFYYTFGNREKNPYPNRLLKISVTTNRSSLTENTEFLFNEKEQLIFYFEKIEGEKRIYFSAEKPILILSDEKSIDLKSKNSLEFLSRISKQKQSLIGIFRKSLN